MYSRLPLRYSLRCLLLAIVFALLAALAPAQEFRVYTSVHACGPEANARRVVARSLTLFHAGRVYDHMEEIGELVVFEPSQNRFVLVRESLATEVSLDELRKMLDVATTSARKYATELATRGDAEALRARDQLAFQLDPVFESRLDPATQRLTLIGSELRYHVDTSTAVAPDVLSAYIAYADWTARLNTVLHSQGTFPAPREALNRSLSEHSLLPVKVTLQGRDPRELHLEAQHEYRWQLQAIDRDLIHQWEDLRESDRLSWVSFREYQQKLLAQTERSGR
jgi:hypothetical protein